MNENVTKERDVFSLDTRRIKTCTTSHYDQLII